MGCVLERHPQHNTAQQADAAWLRLSAGHQREEGRFYVGHRARIYRGACGSGCGCGCGCGCVQEVAGQQEKYVVMRLSGAVVRSGCPVAVGSQGRSEGRSFDSARVLVWMESQLFRVRSLESG